MFHFTTKEFERERRGREAAEAELRDCQRQLAAAQQLAKDRNQVIDEYRDLYRQEVKERRQDQAAHAQQIADLLELLKPRPAEAPASDANATDNATKDPDEILATPAAGKREQMVRRRVVDILRDKAENKAEREARDRRRALLTEEERASVEFDPVLGADFPKNNHASN